MRRLYNLARGSQVPAALLNGLQDEQLGLIAASDASTGATSVALKGADGRWWTSPDAGIPDGELHVVDASVDWRSRRVWGVLRVLGAAARRPGAADDHIPNDPTAAPNTRTFHGWTGSGGVGAAAATVANGTPPVIADNQYAVLLDEGASTSDRVWLYARPADGVLCVYNDSGATLHAELLVWGAAAEVTAGAVPLVYPSPVYVLWLDPSVAASRPATPEPAEQIALHRATDTGEVTLWDGAAWRSLSALPPRLIALFGYATIADATPVVQGLAGFTPADYALADQTTALTLDAIGSVTSGSQTGTLEVLNAAGTVVASIDWTETTPTRKTAAITLPGSAEIYRARVSCAGVVDPLTDYALIGGAHLRITWS